MIEHAEEAIDAIRTLTDLIEVLNRLDQCITQLNQVVEQSAVAAATWDVEGAEQAVTEEFGESLQQPVDVGTLVGQCMVEVEEARAKYLQMSDGGTGG